MPPKRSVVLVSAGLVAGLLVGGSTAAVAVSSATSVKVCVTKSGVVRAADAKGKCPRKTSKRAINVRGPVGPRGATGQRGATGAPGTAAAWGRVNADGTLGIHSPTVKSSRKAYPGPGGAVGIYCVAFTVPLSAPRIESTIATPYVAAYDIPVSAEHNTAHCKAGELAVFTSAGSGTPANGWTEGPPIDADFEFITP